MRQQLNAFISGYEPVGLRGVDYFDSLQSSRRKERIRENQFVHDVPLAVSTRKYGGRAVERRRNYGSDYIGARSFCSVGERQG
jgi:hypothetical protein